MPANEKKRTSCPDNEKKADNEKIPAKNKRR